MEYKCIHIKHSNGRLHVSGDHHVCLGHKVKSKVDSVSDGIFLEWDWNGEKLILRNCRFGLYPAFYYIGNQEICVSTSLLVILERVRSLDLDDSAIAVFLRLGFYLENDTPFKSVRALPPGVELHWNAGGAIMEEKDISASQFNMSRDAAIDGYISLFRSSIEKRVPQSEFALPLSGGRDSRHIFLELCRADRKPDFCLTAELFPPQSNEDVRVARRLCEAYGVKHITIQQGTSYVNAALRKNRLTSFCSDEHTWALPVVDYLNARTNILYDGIAGDVLSAGLFSSVTRLEYFRMGKLAELSRELLGTNEMFLQRGLVPETYRMFSYEKAVARLLSALARHAHQPNPVSSFFFWNRTRREIALYSYGMYSQQMTVFCPYLDHELFDLLVSLPGEVFLDKQFHTDTIARAFPDSEYIYYGLEEWDERSEKWSRLRTRWFSTRLAMEVGQYLLRHRAEKYVNKMFVLPRLAYYMIDGDSHRAWIDLEKVIYLTQLERFMNCVN